MAAQNEGVTQAIGSFYWDDSETVFLGIPTIVRLNIIPANCF